MSDYVCYLAGNLRAEYALCLEYGKYVIYFVADRSDLDVFCLEVRKRCVIREDFSECVLYSGLRFRFERYKLVYYIKYGRYGVVYLDVSKFNVLNQSICTE